MIDKGYVQHKFIDKGYVEQKFIDKGYAQQRLYSVKKYWQNAMLSEIHSVIWSFYVKRNKKKYLSLVSRLAVVEKL